MPSQLRLKLAAILTATALVLAAVEAWRADRRDRAQLAAELAATKQLLAAADSRQRTRDAQLAQTLAAFAAEKRSVLTPAQIVRELSKSIPLPAPITLQNGRASSVGARLSASPALSGQQAAVGGNVGSPATSNAPPPKGGPSREATPAATNSNPVPGGAVIPAADLKPLYDFSLDCQACQAKLSAAQNDLADERQKTAALAKERDDAVRLAKGGNVWRRVGRAAKWFLLGAAAGAAVSKAH